MITNMDEGLRRRINEYKEKIPTLYELCKTDELLKEIVIKFRMIVIKQHLELEEGLLLLENMAVKNELLNSNFMISTEAVDIFQKAGISKPENSVLSDDFLAEIKEMPRKDLALGLLRRILEDEIKIRSKRNIVRSKTFSERLVVASKRYQNNDSSETQIIDELIELAKEIKTENKSGSDLKLD